MWVNDTQNNMLSASVTNGSIIADCNGVPMTAHVGYFVMTTPCASNVHINNTYTGAIMFN
jgi:hypothetical protein